VNQTRRKVLVFAEAVTLAHVARPLALIKALRGSIYDTTLACDPRYSSLFESELPEFERLQSIPPSQFIAALARGKPVYDLPTLEGYVAADLDLIHRHRPDVVVGDFRLSLSVSARLAKLPYLAISNAYWSPDYARPFPMPVLPLTRMLPIRAASLAFDLFGRMAMSQHCKPMNALRACHGLTPLGQDLRRVYTDADHLLIPDVEQLFPLEAGTQPRSYLGPLSWSTGGPLPPWWDEPTPSSLPTVFVSLGSSGDVKDLRLILRALSSLPVRVLASTAGAGLGMAPPENARVANYLPGDLAASRSNLVICNGGSLSTQQALAAGVPVLAIPSNMDQFFNMTPLQERGAGRVIRADRLDIHEVRTCCAEMISSTETAKAALELRPLMTPSVSIARRFDLAAQSL
jgi:UDP:flavonoid glycosyltransferase YjiC (YdhE family)